MSPVTNVTRFSRKRVLTATRIPICGRDREGLKLWGGWKVWRGRRRRRRRRVRVEGRRGKRARSWKGEGEELRKNRRSMMTGRMSEDAS
jgi:hypothetical protein